MARLRPERNELGPRSRPASSASSAHQDPGEARRASARRCRRTTRTRGRSAPPQPRRQPGRRRCAAARTRRRASGRCGCGAAHGSSLGDGGGIGVRRACRGRALSRSANSASAEGAAAVQSRAGVRGRRARLHRGSPVGWRWPYFQESRARAPGACATNCAPGRTSRAPAARWRANQGERDQRLIAAALAALAQRQQRFQPAQVDRLANKAGAGVRLGQRQRGLCCSSRANATSALCREPAGRRRSSGCPRRRRGAGWGCARCRSGRGRRTRPGRGWRRRS